MITGGFSDTAGRRPAYFVCFTIYFFACLGLAIQNSKHRPLCLRIAHLMFSLDYVALLVLRCLQSAGSSGTIAIANGVVSDIVTPQERGAFIAFASLGTILGPSVSPVIGGLLAEYLGWHSIFWFLVIFTGSFCVPFFAFFPETCRKVVGDGSAFPPPLNRCLTDYVRRRKRQENNDPPTQPPPGRQKITFPNPMLTLKAFAVKESAMLLVPAGLSFGSYYALLTGASDTFKTVYGFSEVKVSLMYIPLGAGGIVSAFSTGKLVDWNFQRHARRLGVRLVPNRRQDLSNFPIEKARLQIALPIFCLGSACVIIYGWVIEKQYTVAAPIILMLVMSWAISAFFQVLNVLLVDTYPGRGAAVTAAVNIARCEVGAAAAAAISPMTEGVGAGFAYTIIALITFATLPMLLLAAKFGMKWRGETADKERKKAEEKCARRQVIEGQVPR